MTYNYALQAARQLTFNMWQEGIGYGERSMEEVGIGFADSIKDKKNREGLMLSNNYLTLAKPIVESPATKRWRLFEETWEARTQAEADDVMATVDKKQWLTNFSARCEEFLTISSASMVSWNSSRSNSRNGKGMHASSGVISKRNCSTNG